MSTSLFHLQLSPEKHVQPIWSRCEVHTFSMHSLLSEYQFIFQTRVLWAHIVYTSGPRSGGMSQRQTRSRSMYNPRRKRNKMLLTVSASLPHSTQSALYSSTLLLAKTSGTHQTPLRVPILRLKLLNQNFTVNGALLIVNTLIMSAASVNGLLGVSKSFLL